MLAWLLATVPALVYIVLVLTYFSRIAERRKRVIRLLLASDAKHIYARSYGPDGVDDADRSRIAELKKGPFVAAIALTCVACFAMTATALVKIGLAPAGLPQDLKALIANLGAGVFAGFFGAYVWGLYDCLTRFRVQNWSASSQNFTWLRLIIGTAVGALVAQPFKETYSSLVAFGIGTFPADTIRRWLQTRTQKALGVEASQDYAVSPPWTLIQGVGSETLNRLNEADILSPVHLATADPVVLYCRTNIEWRTILDLIDQAILVTYVADAIEKLRTIGIRGAIEMAVVHERLGLYHAGVASEAEGVVAALATILNRDQMSVRHLIRNLAEDAQVRLIWTLWFREEGGGAVGPTAAVGEPLA